MVTKMKMFAFGFSQTQNQVVKRPVAAPSTPSLNQFNMASTMKMQSTGCKSCRGWSTCLFLYIFIFIHMYIHYKTHYTS